jgi:hypothetical protein
MDRGRWAPTLHVNRHGLSRMSAGVVIMAPADPHAHGSNRSAYDEVRSLSGSHAATASVTLPERVLPLGRVHRARGASSASAQDDRRKRWPPRGFPHGRRRARQASDRDPVRMLARHRILITVEEAIGRFSTHVLHDLFSTTCCAMDHVRTLTLPDRFRRHGREYIDAGLTRGRSSDHRRSDRDVTVAQRRAAPKPVQLSSRRAINEAEHAVLRVLSERRGRPDVRCGRRRVLRALCGERRDRR